MSTIVLNTDFPDLKLINRGKVRDIYDLGDALLMISSDRLSAFDVIMSEGIPCKGRILTSMTEFWLEHLKDIVPNHLISTDINDFPSFHFYHVPGHGLGEKPGSLEVGGNDVIPAIFRKLFEWAPLLYSGIIDQYVYWPVLPGYCFYAFLYSAGTGYVKCATLNNESFFSQFCGCGFYLLFVPAVQNYFCTVTCKASCHDQTKTSTGTGY